jgi:hypothetical protein
MPVEDERSTGMVVGIEHRQAEIRPPSGGDSLLHLQRGQVAALIGDPGHGLTRLGLSLLADHAAAGPVAYLDVRGWLSPLAAWEIGIAPDRLLVGRCGDVVRWGRAAATLLDGVHALYAAVPGGVRAAALRRLGAVARRSRTPLVLRPLRGSIPAGVATLRIEVDTVTWVGTERGHGRLRHRRSRVIVSGKAVHGMTRRVELEDDGENAVRLVSDLGVAEARRAVG